MAITQKTPLWFTLENNSSHKIHSGRNKSKMDQNCSSFISTRPLSYKLNRSKMKTMLLKYHLKSYKHLNPQRISTRSQILRLMFLKTLTLRIVSASSSTLKLEGPRRYKMWIWIHQRSYTRKTVIIVLFR